MAAICRQKTGIKIIQFITAGIVILQHMVKIQCWILVCLPLQSSLYGDILYGNQQPEENGPYPLCSVLTCRLL